MVATISPVSAKGSFTFTTALVSGTTYSVTVSAQPTNPAQTCSVTNGSWHGDNRRDYQCGRDVPSRTTTLIVADPGNNRVLIYDAPFSTGQNANVVLGQTNFTTATVGTTASTMNGPVAVAADSAGNLYVAENGQLPVTQFVPPFSNGMNASVVFGQPNLTSGNCACPGISASTLGKAPGKTADERLWCDCRQQRQSVGR